MSNALVVGGLDDGDKVAGAEHRILGDHFAAEVSNLLVYLVQAVWVAVQRPASLGRQRAQQNVRWHRAFLLRRSVVQGDGSVSGFALGVCSNLSASGKPTSSRTVYAPLAVREFRRWPTRPASSPNPAWTSPRYVGDAPSLDAAPAVRTEPKAGLTKILT